jgi:hypothetical protein
MILLSLCLTLSLLVNGVLIWYCRQLAKQFVFFTRNVSDLEAALGDFDSHLKGVHELETFYGDETLQGLIEHSRAIVGQIGDFYDGFSLEEAAEEIDDET